MEKIIIVGCSGAGKSTLSIALNRIINIPVFHLDTFYWKDNWVKSKKMSSEKF